ncbi:MAG: PhoX family phosphatase [Idiomarina sp.]|nr:PhoX family phosphatase [Idiomarina sp.]
MNQRFSRRTFLKGSLGLAITSFFAPALSGCSSGSMPARPLAFEPIAANRLDQITLPPGYNARPFIPWGTPLMGNAPEFAPDASNNAADQALQVGSHHDGMHYFPIDLPRGGSNSSEGLLVLNHEYVDLNLIHPQGANLEQRQRDEVEKELNAHGVSVVHIMQRPSGDWDVVQQSPLNRRITGFTPMAISGPVRGHPLLVTQYSPGGTHTRGTINNCSHGVTPWGTYLTCEENWAGSFVNRDDSLPREHERYGILRQHSWYRWDEVEQAPDHIARFDASTRADSAAQDYRNEPNHFGWIVEIDPFNPNSMPVKRTAMGRFAHEGVIFAPAVEGEPLVAYSGDDARFEYIYKFVSAAPYEAATASGRLLDSGTLYVARFNADGTGEWLALSLEDADFMAKAQAAGHNFDSQADILLNTRLAADIAGATKMDRPEWGAVDPQTGAVYFTLTNNMRRTNEQIDPANPRAENAHGHIIRWHERESNQSRTFDWDLFLMGGDVGQPQPNADLQATTENHFACPDGLWFDPQGTLWIQTDMSGDTLAKGPFGNNAMLAANPQTGELKRFLVGPVDCEITGVVTTPDQRTMFVNVQHPGEGSKPEALSSHWPDGGTSRPRSATIIITKDDGGVIGG